MNGSVDIKFERIIIIIIIKNSRKVVLFKFYFVVIKSDRHFGLFHFQAFLLSLEKTVYKDVRSRFVFIFICETNILINFVKMNIKSDTRRTTVSISI